MGQDTIEKELEYEETDLIFEDLDCVSLKDENDMRFFQRINIESAFRYPLIFKNLDGKK